MSQFYICSRVREFQQISFNHDLNGQRLDSLSVFGSNYYIFFRYRCVESYPAATVYEISLTRGDLLYVTRRRSDGWLKGRLERGRRTGWFPGTFVEPM